MSWQSSVHISPFNIDFDVEVTNRDGGFLIRTDGKALPASCFSRVKRSNDAWAPQRGAANVSASHVPMGKSAGDRGGFVGTPQP